MRARKRGADPKEVLKQTTARPANPGARGCGHLFLQIAVLLPDLVLVAELRVALPGLLELRALLGLLLGDLVPGLTIERHDVVRPVVERYALGLDIGHGLTLDRLALDELPQHRGIADDADL